MDLKRKIREIDDFPIAGVSFKDITTLLKDGVAYREAIEQLRRLVQHLDIDVIAGPEARGFVIGAPLSYAMGVGFVPIRKSGKLPGKTLEADYNLEYGQDKLAIHEDAILPGQKVLLADDLLATGGTIATSVELIRRSGGHVVGTAFLIELAYLHGRNKLSDVDIYTLITYK